MRTVRTVAAGRLVITPAVVGDAGDVMTLHLGVLTEGRYFVTADDELFATAEWQAQRIRDHDRQGNSVFLVGRLDGRLAGFVTLTGGSLRRMAHVAKLEIMVDSAFRGAGVGRALMEAALLWATEHPTLLKVGLAVFDDNERAAALYRSLGFIEEGRRPGEYRERDGTLRGDLLMAKWVGGEALTG